MTNPFDYMTKTQDTLSMGNAQYDELIEWCNGDASKAFHLLEVFFDKDDVLENVISKSGEFAYKYAKGVLMDRFVLGEEAIMNSEYKDQYLSFMIQEACGV